METPEPQPQPPPAPGRDDRQADLAFACSVVGLILAWLLIIAAFRAIGVVLFVSAILSYAVLPVIDWLDRRGVHRILSMVLVALVGVGLVVLAVVLLTPSVSAQLAQLPEMVRETLADLRGVWERLRGRLPPAIADNLAQIEAWLASSWRRVLPTERVGEWAGSAAAGLSTFASVVVFVPVFVFLMLRGFHPFVEAVRGLIPPRWRPRFELRSGQADEVLSGFVRGQLLVALIIGSLYAVAFTLVGIPLGLVVGLIAGLGELVPYLGGAIALVLASLLALAGGQPLDVLWVVAIFAAVQALEGALISPWIVGRTAELKPGAVIVALAIGGEVLGLVGLLAAVPAAALLKVAARATIDAYRGSSFFVRRRPA